MVFSVKNSKNNIGFKLSVIFILAVTAIAALAPLLAPNDPNAADMLLANAAPSPGYPLGNDQLGRCLLSRVLYGARIICFFIDIDNGHRFCHRNIYRRAFRLLRRMD